MVSRAALVVSMVAALAVPVAADAAPRQSCRLVRDAANDSYAAGGPVNGLPMASTDIVSADLASESTYITAAITVRDLSARASETDAIGFGLSFLLHGSRYELYGGESHARGTEFTLWHQTGGSFEQPEWGFKAYASGLLDDDSSTAYVTVPLTMLGVDGTDHIPASRLRAASGFGADALFTGGGSRTDLADSDASYRLGTPSCSPAPVEPCRNPQPAGIPRQDTCPGGA
jgi:hypothetical protein